MPSGSGQLDISAEKFTGARLVAQKFDGARRRAYPGRPRVSPEIEALVVRFARENRGWGYDRIVGALSNLGHPISDQTVGNILRRLQRICRHYGSDPIFICSSAAVRSTV